MAETTAEFRHNFLRFRCFRVYYDSDSQKFSVCMLVGKIKGTPDFIRKSLTGQWKVGYARDIAANYGRETWRYDQTKEQVKAELRNWRKRCSLEGQDEVITIT